MIFAVRAWSSDHFGWHLLVAVSLLTGARMKSSYAVSNPLGESFLDVRAVDTSLLLLGVACMLASVSSSAGPLWISRPVISRLLDLLLTGIIVTVGLAVCAPLGNGGRYVLNCAVAIWVVPTVVRICLNANAAFVWHFFLLAGLFFTPRSGAQVVWSPLYYARPSASQAALDVLLLAGLLVLVSSNAMGRRRV